MRQANKEVVADPCICLFDLYHFGFKSRDSKVSEFPIILAGLALISALSHTGTQRADR
jgi:hypothetical protein